ncbi:MAG TPA: F0F1 ATP synthase subunit delta [Lacunisphaera sp.]|jgi:F-type H+-transporting ATPase subunit delta
MAADKKTKLLARQLFKLSFEDGQVSADQVSGVLGWVSKHSPRHPLALLQLYQRLITTELARSQAVVSHAGPLAEGVLTQIEQAMTQKYRRPVTANASPDSSLLAGIRVRVGDDIYESSAASQLAALSA